MVWIDLALEFDRCGLLYIRLYRSTSGPLGRIIKIRLANMVMLVCAMCRDMLYANRLHYSHPYTHSIYKVPPLLHHNSQGLIGH